MHIAKSNVMLHQMQCKMQYLNPPGDVVPCKTYKKQLVENSLLPGTSPERGQEPKESSGDSWRLDKKRNMTIAFH
ncbi:MAG: hypothetical protein AB7F20_15020 [Geoalkalibacter sp.]|uniref:hypothetical protein n=1 Tax=Geoalkalibacter sp. TaxID=3041440 RepID=UPI003D0C1210